TDFTNTTIVLPGRAVLFAPTSTGTLRFRGSSSGGGGGTSGGAANAGPDITVVTPEVTLDASASKDPDGGTLTYMWKSIGRSVAISDPTSARPRVQLGEGFGIYRFELTVTTSKGVTSTDIVEVLYVGSPE
ncbi:MAG TPA: hypothetical protein VHN20_06205, partial [Beijerinckiaceae bacterium]|nr:hypothetical protein [Beijerinckiaceae bacterium]